MESSFVGGDFSYGGDDAGVRGGGILLRLENMNMNMDRSFSTSKLTTNEKVL